MVSVGQVISLIKAFGGSGGGGGSSSSIFVLTVDPETFLLNMTWQEIHDALAAGKIGTLAIMHDENSVTVWLIDSVYYDSGYVVEGVVPQGSVIAHSPIAGAMSANDYPMVID